MTTTQALKEICVYWDTQGTQEGWAYRAMGVNGMVDSGGCYDCDTLEEAVDCACCWLGVDRDSIEFAFSKDEGGFAVWVSEFEENE